MNIHTLLDTDFGPDGIERLRAMLEAGAAVDERGGPLGETPLHVAARRYRTAAVDLLLDFGAAPDLETRGGKTAYAHAIRRGFGEVAETLQRRGASTKLNAADRIAVALSAGRVDEARAALSANPGLVRTGEAEEDRLLADMAGRSDPEPVRLLVEAGADLVATGLDTGTPLHQAAWFGQPTNARILVDAGAPLDVFEPTHRSSPIGWAVHGSRYSGGAEQRTEEYVAVTRLLLEAGSGLRYPDEPSVDAYLDRLRAYAAPAVLALLPDRSDPT